MNIEVIRNYRIALDSGFNDKGKGISLLDLLGTFIIAYLVRSLIPIDYATYYLALMPIAILSHVLVGQKTFLNSQLSNNNFNIYKILVAINLYYLIKAVSKNSLTRSAIYSVS